jgi:MFS family permease
MADSTKLFGMQAEKGRWIFVLLGFFMNLCLGSIYAYSIFKPFVEKEFGVKAFLGNLPFMIFFASFAVLMFFGGKIMERVGPRNLSLIGGLIFGLGWALSSVTKNITMLTITFGVIAGSGVGLAYGCPVALCARWFPDRKGLAVGLMLACFGGSALITGNIANKLIPTAGLFTTFLYFGISFAVILVILSLPFKFPQAGWKPEGWAPAAGSVAETDYDTAGMTRTATFWGLFFCYTIGCLVGLMAIGISKPVGSELILFAGGTAGMLVGIFAVFNALGNPLFGALTDKFTPKWAAVLNLTLIFIVSILMIFAKDGRIEAGSGVIEVKDGKLILIQGAMIDKNTKANLKAGALIINPADVEKVDNDILFKEGSIVQENDKMIIKTSAIKKIDKDGQIDLAQGAVLLNPGAFNYVPGSVVLYIIAFIGFWLCLGGWLAIAPTATATFFGMKNYVRNYGLVFFAYGIGAILGGIISGQAKDMFGSYAFSFYPTAALAIVGILLALAFIKPPKK